jgi:ABC-type phosphate transport system substrate-binding protein
VIRLFLVLTIAIALLPLQSSSAEQLLIIANPSVGEIASLSLKEVAAIYLLRVTAWPNGAHIVPVNREITSDVRTGFTAAVLQQDVASLAAYWNEMHFQGKLPPVVQESEPAMLAFVQRVPGAIGYISATTPAVGVKVLGHVH